MVDEQGEASYSTSKLNSLPNCMDRPRSFTGRTRRLTNRWSVQLADALARGLITIGGIGTIVAVLLVFVFLLYVAFPVFLPSELEQVQTTSRSSAEVPFLFDVDENNVLTTSLYPDGRLHVKRIDNDELLSEQALFETPITSAAMYPEADEFAAGLPDGTVVFGQLAVPIKFYRAADLPDEVRDLAPGELIDFESGVVERTSQGMYRWQSVEATLNEPLAISDSAIVSLDFLRTEAGVALAALNERGEAFVARIREERNILDEVTVELSKRAVQLPAGRGNPWRIFLLGRGNRLLVLWEDGAVARYDLPSSGEPVLVEERKLINGNAKLTAALMLSGRYTLVVGDSTGKCNAWFTAKVPVGDHEQENLMKAHELPAFSSAVTSLTTSRLLRLLAAGSEEGELKVYFVTTNSEILSTQAFEHSAVSQIALSPNDDSLLAISGDQQWRAALEPRHPDANLTSLFRPVWYEDYPKPMHKWQSTTSVESEPKYGLMPLIVGTLKATFYSMLFGTPIALLAAVYTSEFVDPSMRGPIKSTIELMASVPSVVLGFIAGLVFAPFVESVLPTLLAAMVIVPFAFLVGAQFWQQIPHKITLQLAKFRLGAIAFVLLLGCIATIFVGPALLQSLFGGDFKVWLNQRQGEATPGWFLLLLPLTTVATCFVVNSYANPWLRQRCGSLPRSRFALLNFGKFILATAITLLVTYALAKIVHQLGFDPRGTIVDTYVQRNALVVSFIMGFAIIPIIYTISEDALSTVPQHLRSASLGCGATTWQTAWRVVVPTAASGLFSAVMVGMGRAVGETMIMLMATGNVPLMEMNPFNGFRSLSANIAEEMPESAPWSTHFRILFLTALTLLIITFFINTAAEAIRISFRRRASQI